MRLRLESEQTVTQKTEYYKAINWNAIEDVVDKATWEKLTEQFWLDTRIPLSNDLDDWRRLSDKERDLVGKVFGGLTLLDTLQGTDGVSAIRPDVRTPHEDAVLSNVSFMEQVHAKSYSSIFSTLNTKAEIEEIFDWTANNKYLQKKAEIIKHIYETGSPLQKKAASVFLESFLFYSGFFTPLWYLGNNKLPNVAEIIKLILRDECLSSDHELLTPKGWVSVADIRPGDIILQFNPKTRKSEFASVQTVSTDYVPKLYNFSSKNGYVNLTCTPKHRLIRKSLTSDQYKIREAENTYGQTAYWLHPRPLELNEESDLEHEVSLWEEFYIVASKYGSVVRAGEGYSLTFTFRRPQMIERLRYLLNSLRIYFKETDFKTTPDIAFRIPSLFNSAIDVNNLKQLPKRDLTEVSLHWVTDYLDKLIFWYGHKNSKNSLRYITSNRDSLDWVQALATLAGYKTRVREDAFYKSEFLPDDTPHYCLIFVTNECVTTGHVVERTEVEGAQVYGIQVPSGFLVTRGKGGSVVITGNSVHGTYIGYKFQLAFNELPEEEQEELKAWVYDLLYELYENEERYTEELYDEIGWTEEVKTFLRYNANKALMNLGLDPLFPEGAEDVNPIIMNGISTGTSNHDFFSQVGNGYLLGQVEAMKDEDYTVGL